MSAEKIGPIKFQVGADNRSPEYAMPAGSARVLDNLDVTSAGGLISRKGARLVSAGKWSSPFAHPAGFLLAVRDGSLVAVMKDATISTLATVSGPVAFALLDDSVYWTDGGAVGKVSPDGTLAPWGLAVPPRIVCSAAATGGLPAGDYAVTITAVHASGIESGAPEPVVLSVPESGGVEAFAPTAPGYTFNVYATPAFGESVELRRVGSLGSGESAIFGPLDAREKLESLFATKPPAGSALAAYRGRLWIAEGETLWFTSERSPHWVFRAGGFFQFESSIAMIGATEDGLYVGLSDRVYFLQGADPGQMARRVAASVGAIRGGGQTVGTDLFVGESIPASQCAWVDSDGFPCLGKPGGTVARPTAGRFVTGVGSGASCCDRRVAGIRQLVSLVSGDDPIVSPLSAIDVPVSVVYPHGVTI